MNQLCSPVYYINSEATMGEGERRDGLWHEQELLHRQWGHDSTGRLGDVQEWTDHTHPGHMDNSEI